MEETGAPVDAARDEYADQMNLELRQSIAANVLEAMDVDQYLIDAVRNATPDATTASVASRQRVAEVLSSATRDMDYKRWETPEGMLPFADALLAAGVFRDEATVVTDALEDAADAIIVPGASSVAADWLRERARLLALKAAE